MTALVLDAGALIALDRNNRDMWARLYAADKAGDIVATPAGAIAQTWRGGRRQALLSRALMHCDEIALDGPIARACGRLCAGTGTADVIDASVAVAAAEFAHHTHTVIATSDPDDIGTLTSALNAQVSILTV
ncbi:twitching motility protein PilT [Candidatus Poriferisodalis sp.]|uniref:twitching motility protein PilT n=1 Tax=Candidatus Poriferisodalis sp. TaxID=3101277 RepID=UPI003C6EF90D